ncbi:MAG: hypothetical protein GF368_05585 [Candidatus Aenigmarchaeota archaeon]|nr:hypothetical protein [Candidatus Aenigmarchaeota archaeon]
MRGKTLIPLVIFLIFFGSSDAWWDSSWEKCRNIHISPPESDFTREREFIELWVGIDQNDCDSIRVVNASCDEIGMEVKRYISYRNQSGCEVRFQVNRNKGSERIYSLYYKNPNSNESGTSENYFIFADNFEGLLKRDWMVEFNTSDSCGIFNKVGNKVFRSSVSGSEGICTLILDSNSNVPSSLYLNFSVEVIEGDRNYVRIYLLNSTYRKNDYFGITNMVNFDVSTANDPKLEAKAGENLPGPCPNSGYSVFPLNGENFTEVREDPIKDNLFHEAIFRYSPNDFFYELFLDGVYEWNFQFSPDNVNWNNNKFLWRVDFWDSPQTHTVDMDVLCIVTDDQECHVYNSPSLVNLGPEQTLSHLEINLSIPKNIFVDEDTNFQSFVSYGDNPITNLTSNNFEILLNNQTIEVENFRNLNNGNYRFSINPSSEKLGSGQLRIIVNFGGKSTEANEKINLLIQPNSKPLIITDTDWKNYISSASLDIPVLVYNSSRKLIDKFVEDHSPDQIFQLGVKLSFNGENYLVDSRETMIKIFFDEQELVVPMSKQIAIKSSFLGKPVLFEPSTETLQFLEPNIIHNLTSIEQVDEMFKGEIPEPFYFILTDPIKENSIFSFSLAKEKDAFTIFSTGDPEESKEIIFQKINDFNLPDSYYLDTSIYLALISTAYFSVGDPVNAHREIISDTNYCDINDDGYQDLACGRLIGSPESMSYQLEYSKIFEEDKTALILASYSTPGKYFDVLSAGGTMLTGTKTEIELLKKGFNVKRLVEKRSELDQIDSSLLKNLNDLTGSLRITEAASYIGLFSGIIGDFTKITLFMKAGSKILYSVYEFDWLNYWSSIFDPNKQSPQHLPIFNEENLVSEVKNSQVIAYFSKGNGTHWLIPINSTRFSTLYDEFDPSNLSNNPLFYYLGYSDSFDTGEKFLENGVLSLVSTSSDFYNLYSGETAFGFFKEFDQAVGKTMLTARNRNYELSQTDLNTNRTYEKEYYDIILLGDPSLTFDPNLDFQESMKVEVDDGDYVISYSINPSYDIVDFSEASFIIFDNTDDHLLENNKPILPLYKERFILPASSEILGFSVELSGRTYDGIELPIINPDPDYFENEIFNGQFPEEFYWSYEIGLLDNRTLFDILLSPVIYFSNNTVRVFDEIEVYFRYSSSMEITNVDAVDVERGDTQIIDLEIFNSLPQSKMVDLTLVIETEEFKDKITEQLEVAPGGNTFEIGYNDTDYLGNYSITVLIIGDGIVAGPKYTYFEVSRRPLFEDFWYPVSNFFKKTFQGFSFKSRSFREDYRIMKEEDKTILDYQSLEIKIHIEQDNEKTITWIKTGEGKLRIQQEPGMLDYQLSTPEGSLHIIKERGEIKEDSSGDTEELKRALKSIIQSYQNKLEDLDLTS